MGTDVRNTTLNEQRVDYRHRSVLSEVIMEKLRQFTHSLTAPCVPRGCLRFPRKGEICEGRRSLPYTNLYVVERNTAMCCGHFFVKMSDFSAQAEGSKSNS